MHLVIINQYYPPDVAPTGMMLESVVDQLIEMGHEVSVVCSASEGYSGNIKNLGNSDAVASQLNNVDLGRLDLIRVNSTSFGRRAFVGKLVDYLTFYIGVAWKVVNMKRRPDRVIALTTPPFLSVIARAVSKLRGGDHGHWVMDLYPDVMAAHGLLSPNSVSYRILKAIACWGFGGDRCSCVLTLGPDMASRVQPYLPERVPVKWVPLWNSGLGHSPSNDEIMSLRESRGWESNEHVVMYSGNMGLGHSFDEILQVATSDCVQLDSNSPPRDYSSSVVRFAFFGDGKRRGEIAQRIEKNPDCLVELYPYVNSELLDTHLATADVHVVSLRPDWDGTMLPSKLQGIFAAGRPVILIGSEESSIGRWVLESGGGWVVPPGDVQALAIAVEQSRIPAENEQRGKFAREFSEKRFNRAENSHCCAAVLSS
ncbi:glycosyltransferase family 4 protein [Oceaniferula spumae]